MRLMEFFGMTEAGMEQDPTRDSGKFDPFERPRGAGYYRMAVPDEVRARWSEFDPPVDGRIEPDEARHPRRGRIESIK